MNGKHQSTLLAVATILGMTVLTACNPPANDQRLQEQAAQATEQAKQGSKEALADARVAAKNAEQAVNDVAAGVKQGLDNKSTPSAQVDLNSASSISSSAFSCATLVSSSEASPAFQNSSSTAKSSTAVSTA